MNLRSTIVCIALMMCLLQLTAQKQMGVVLKQTSVNAHTTCFDISLKSEEGARFDLAGQNYRLFYDTDNLELQEKSIVSHLSRKAYSNIDVTKEINDDIGLLSLSIDGQKKNEKTTSIDRYDEQTVVASLCFNRLSNEDIDIRWAGAETKGLASAFVALSEWKNTQHQSLIEAHTSIEWLDQQDQQVTEIDLKVYPNPVIDYVQVDLDRLEGYGYVIITDILGREVVYDRIFNQSSMIYDLSNWPTGQYTVRFQKEGSEQIMIETIVKSN